MRSSHRLASLVICVAMVCALVVPRQLFAETSKVTVLVRTTDGVPVRLAYVALVPLWRQSNQPIAEQIATDGIAVLDVPPGTYQVIAGARGFSVTAQPPADLGGAAKTKVTVLLSALRTVRGTLRTDEGRALVGARVATGSGAILAPLGKLSDLAVRHLSADWRTVTDQSGSWTLQVPEGTVPLFFEAPGAAAEWRVVSPKDALPLEVTLSKAGALTLTTDRIDPNLVVTLSREDEAGRDAVFADEQTLVWARWAEKNSLVWTSLPPGTYGVYAKYPDPRYFMQAAVKLANVTLLAGEERKIVVELPPVRRIRTRITSLFVRDTRRSALRGELETFGRDATGGPRALEHFVEEVTGGSVIHVNTDGARPPVFAMTADRFFATVPSAVAEGTRNPQGEPWPMAIYPRSDVHFGVRFAEKNLVPPQAGLAVLRDCGEGGEVTVPIEIRRLQVGQFSAASGCASMILDFDPFEPVVSDRVLAPGDQSLGELVLRGASSADVRVVRDPGGAAVVGGTVKVVSDETQGGLPIEVTKASTDEGGWAHITGLPSSWKLRVIAETAEREKSDAVVLRVLPRERGLIDPLEIPEPATLIVDAKIDEAFLAHFPAAKFVGLFVRSADPDRDSERRDGNVNTGSPTRFERLQPGRWLVSGVVSVAGTYSPADIDDLTLKAGETRHVAATIAPNVFEGIVTSEGKPVVAKVIVDDGSQRIYFTSGASGSFHAALQRKGVYPVAVARLSAQGNMIPVGDVAFVDPARRIEIELPAGGTVTTRVKSGDQLVSRATVWLSRRAVSGTVEELTNRAQTTGENGTTTFNDLAAGIWTFAVRDQNGRAAEKSISIENGQTTTLDLELSKAPAIEGTIRDLGGVPLPRARVDCLYVGPSGNPDRVSADTDSEGTFAITLTPPAPAIALCSIVDPMGRVDAFKAAPGQPVSLAMTPGSGALRVPNWQTYPGQELLWMVARDGRVINMSAVAAKVGRFGTPLEISAFPPGFWKIVRVATLPEALLLATGMGASLPGVAEGDIRAGTTATMQLRESLSGQ